MVKRASFFGARHSVARKADEYRFDVEQCFTDWATEVIEVRFSKPQTVFCKVVFDRVDPADLSPYELEIAKSIFANQRGDMPDRFTRQQRRTLFFEKGARMGGTWMCSLYLCYAAFKVSLAGLGKGERAFGPIISFDKDTALQGLNYVRGALEESPMKRYIYGRPRTESVTIKRDDGKIVRFKVFSAGGKTSRSRSYVSVVLDELAFFRSKEAKVNDVETFRSVEPRVINDTYAMTLGISTVWAEAGLLYERVETELGKPVTCIPAKCRTLVMRPDDEKLRDTVASSYATDPLNAAREFDCVPFKDGGVAFFSKVALAACTDDRLVVPKKPPQIATSIGAGGDFGFKRNSSALAITYRQPDGVYVVSALEERLPGAIPLKPSVIVRDFAAIATEQRAHSVMADEHERSSIEEHFADHGVSFDDAPAGTTGKEATHIFFRSLLNEGKIRLPRNEKLLNQLGEVVATPGDGGRLHFHSPTWKTGEHGDLASALILAAYTCHHNSPLQPQIDNRRRGRNFDQEFERELNRELDHDHMASDLGLPFSGLL
jgi:hypothetical protein